MEATIALAGNLIPVVITEMPPLPIQPRLVDLPSTLPKGELQIKDLALLPSAFAAWQSLQRAGEYVEAQLLLEGFSPFFVLIKPTALTQLGLVLTFQWQAWAWLEKWKGLLLTQAAIDPVPFTGIWPDNPNNLEAYLTKEWPISPIAFPLVYKGPAQGQTWNEQDLRIDGLLRVDALRPAVYLGAVLQGMFKAVGWSLDVDANLPWCSWLLPNTKPGKQSLNMAQLAKARFVTNGYTHDLVQHLGLAEVIPAVNTDQLPRMKYIATSTGLYELKSRLALQHATNQPPLTITWSVVVSNTAGQQLLAISENQEVLPGDDLDINYTWPLLLQEGDSASVTIDLTVPFYNLVNIAHEVTAGMSIAEDAYLLRPATALPEIPMLDFWQWFIKQVPLQMSIDPQAKKVKLEPIAHQAGLVPMHAISDKQAFNYSVQPLTLANPAWTADPDDWYQYQWGRNNSGFFAATTEVLLNINQSNGLAKSALLPSMLPRDISTLSAAKASAWQEGYRPRLLKPRGPILDEQGAPIRINVEGKWVMALQTRFSEAQWLLDRSWQTAIEKIVDLSCSVPIDLMQRYDQQGGGIYWQGRHWHLRSLKLQPEEASLQLWSPVLP